MENASQALIIGGTILLAILVLSVGVYLISSYSKAGESYEQTLSITEITKFNANFTKFIDRTNITAQEIITLKNFVENYKETNGTITEVKYPGSERSEKSEKADIEFITNNSTKYFRCEKNSIEYNSEGRVEKIEFKL